MTELRTTFALTEEQQKLINDLYDGEGECFCGEALEAGKDRALLAQPFSRNAKDEAGQFAVRAFCGDCFKLIQERLKHIRARQKFAHVQVVVSLLICVFGSGCVSLGYHQRTVNTARRDALEEAHAIIEQAKRAEITFRDADYLIEESLAKETLP